MSSNNYSRGSFSNKLREWSNIYRIYAQKVANQNFGTVDHVFDDLAEYDSCLKKYTQSSLSESKVFEVGYGQRPFRLMAMMSHGYNAIGIDLETPLLSFNFSNLISICKNNGLERCLKTLIRYFLNDRKEKEHFRKRLAERNLSFAIQPENFLVQDLLNTSFPEHQFDLITSEDVFEHIPQETLESMLPKLKQWIKPSGLLLIRPNIFTGITGGHLTDWFIEAMPKPLDQKDSEPWEHLRKDRIQPASYLNKMTRQQYRDLFSQHFEILEEIVKSPNLGQEWMTPDIREELKNYSDEELFSNQVLFVLRCKSNS